MRRLTILSVAYPFARVDEDPVGGAEQVLAQLDRALVARGHRSLVIASAGSRTAGTLIPIAATHTPDTASRLHVQRTVRAAIYATLARESVDVLHLHGFDFHNYLPACGPPALVTLHLPLDWYPPAALRPQRPRTWLQPVSAAQSLRAPAAVQLLPPIDNGVDCAQFPHLRKRVFALMLGRVCREKGFHDALDACRHAGVPLLVAGDVFAWPEHQEYFAAEVVPRLDAQRRWIGAIAGARKRRLLAAARCVLIPSRAPETSSLVAMEALAAGTPVIAYASGALPDIVTHDRTGFIVDDVEAMSQALHRLDTIDVDDCRAAARTRFPIERTIDSYLAVYRKLRAAAHASVPAAAHRLPFSDQPPA